MTRNKKLILSLGLMFTMVLIAIVGVCVFNKPDSKSPTPAGQTQATDKVEVISPVQTVYQPGELLVTEGNYKTINYKYEPINNSTSFTTPIGTAYEYMFANTMSGPAAVYLKSIDTTAVNVQYAYSTSKLTSESTFNVSDTYTIQNLPNTNSVIYIYVIVTPTNTYIPAEFSTSLKWNYGRATTVTVANNVDTSTTSQTLVDGQLMEAPATPTAPSGYTFDAWFLDEDFTELATFPLNVYGQTLYARFHNFPLNSSLMTLSNGTYTCTHAPSGVTDLIIPTYYSLNGSTPALVTAIGNNFINIDESIKSITFPMSIQTMGSNLIATQMIAPFSSLSNVDFSSCINLTSIGVSFFTYMESVETIDLSVTKLTVLPDLCFANCHNVKTVVLPTTLTTIKEGALPLDIATSSSISLNVNLDECINLTTIEDRAFTDSHTEYLVPDIDLSKCYKLTSIGTAFNSCSIQSIILPDSITSIAENAFSGCSSLTSIVVPGEVTSIGDNAFYECVALESVSLSACSKLTTIGESAFRNCSSLIRIRIPNQVTSIGANAFDGCYSLEIATLPKNLATMGDYCFQNCSALVEVNGLEQNTSLTTIPSYAFNNCTNLNNITLPTNLTTLSTRVFYYCSSLTSVTLPSSLETIGYGAFQYCPSLITVGDLSASTNLTTINDAAFYNCGSLTSITLPNSVTSIGGNAFTGCYSLSKIVIPTGVTSILANTFTSCFSLTSVTIPSGVTSIGGDAFKECFALAEVYNLSSLTLTQGTTDNGYIAYYAKVIHTNASTQSKLEVIGDTICYKTSDGGYMALTPVDKTKTNITIDDRVTSINEYAFYKCTAIQSIIVPNSVTSIGVYAFYGWENLQYTTYDNGKYLGNSANPYLILAKASSTAITSCTINSNTRFICDDVFYQCSSLTSITIPNSVTSIGGFVFYGTSLTNITIPSSVTTIGYYVFYNCSSLASITFEDTSTWYRTTDRMKWNNKTGATLTDVTNATQNATWFKDATSGHCYCYLYKL